MKIKLAAAFAFAALPLMAAAGAADSGATYPPAHGGKSVTVPSIELKFQHTGLKGEDGSEILVVDGYGDQKSREHGTFMKFAYGFKSPVHSHTYDYYGVVIQGEMANYNPGRAPIKMDPGSYWYQRGLEAHITECLSKDGCVAWVVQSQKFDAQIPPKIE